MVRKEVTYTDYNGEQQTDILYFNLNKAELGKLQMRMDGKFLDNLQLLAEKRKVTDLYDFVYNLLLDSYGERTADGKRFLKNREMREEFENSIAFSEALMDVIADTDKMSEFIRNILPPDMVTKAGAVDAKALPPTN